MEEEDDITTACRQLYADTNRIYDQHREQLGPNTLGFKILYGPPHLNAPALFVGDQPGGIAAEDFKNERVGWASRCEYATENWALARHMQGMFGTEFLLECVGININFFRARSAATWKTVPKNLRSTLEGFCQGQLEKLILLLKPQQIITIGFSTLGKLCLSEPLLYGSKERVLMRRGTVGQFPAVSTLHLSGARMAREDRRMIAEAVLGNVPKELHHAR